MRPVTKSYKPGAFLFHENDHSRELYIIQSGQVRIFRKVGHKEIPLAVVGKGSVLGEMALIDGKPRSASAQALEESQVVLIDSETFHSKTRGVPPWFLSIIRMTSLKIRKANDRLQKAHSGNSGANVILALTYLLTKARADNPDCSELPTSLTCNQLVKILGVPSHRVMKMVDFLVQHGFVEMTETSLQIIDLQRLEEYARFLRLLLRKAFEKIQPLSIESAELVLALGEQHPDLVAPAEQEISLEGDDLWLLMSDLGLTKSSQAVMDNLAEHKLLNENAGAEDGEGANPLSGKKYKAVSTTWMTYYLFNKYKLMVPVS